MKFTNLLLTFAPLTCFGTASGLLNHTYVRDFLTHEATWRGMHGASKENLGAGMLYYVLAYAAQAKLCVCLGSGDGFVPRILR